MPVDTRSGDQPAPQVHAHAPPFPPLFPCGIDDNKESLTARRQANQLRRGGVCWRASMTADSPGELTAEPLRLNADTGPRKRHRWQRNTKSVAA